MPAFILQSIQSTLPVDFLLLNATDGLSRPKKAMPTPVLKTPSPLPTEALRLQIATLYSTFWLRILARWTYIREVLNIHLHDDVLPISHTAGCQRVYLLDKEKAIVATKSTANGRKEQLTSPVYASTRACAQAQAELHAHWKL